MMSVSDRAAQWRFLLAAIVEARRAGDDAAREDAEWALTRFLRGETIELPADYKVAQYPSEERE